MATEVYSTLEIKLQDGREVTLKPLVLKALRKFMKAFKNFGEDVDVPADASDEDKAELQRDHEYDVFITLAGIALEKQLKAKVTEGADEDKVDEVYRDYLEETLDMETIFKIIEVCAGMKLDDPNLLAVAAQNLAEGGTN